MGHPGQKKALTNSLNLQIALLMLPMVVIICSPRSYPTGKLEPLTPPKQERLRLSTILAASPRNLTIFDQKNFIQNRHYILFATICIYLVFSGKIPHKNYAGINLTGYHPPGTQRLAHQNVCPAPGLLHNRNFPGAGPINDDVPGAGHLYQLAFKHESYHTVIWA